MTELRGLILDWGGVLTSDLSGAMTAWANEEQVDLEQFANVMREWLGREGEIESFVNPVHSNGVRSRYRTSSSDSQKASRSDWVDRSLRRV